MDSSFFMQSPYGGWNQTQINNEQIESESHPQQSQLPSMVRPLNRVPPVSKSTGTAGMFYKTRMCKRFWAGFCRNGDLCRFAHGIEDLRRPPSNWQELLGPEPEPEPVREKEPVENVGNVEGEEEEAVTVSKQTVEYCGNKLSDFKKVNRIYGDWIDDLPVGHE